MADQRRAQQEQAGYGDDGDPELSPTSSVAVPAMPMPDSPPDSRQALHPRIRRRNRLITSCLECRRRKLKCDKTAPCTNCTRFKRDCLYLAPSSDPKSQQKLADIKEKMGLLEQSLEQEVVSQTRKSSDAPASAAAQQYIKQEDDSEEEGEDEEDLEPTMLTAIDAVYENDVDDELIDLGVQVGKLRITERIGGWVRPKMVEELSGTLKEINEEKSDGNAYSQTPESYRFDAFQRQQNLHGNQKSFLGPGPDYIAPAACLFFPGTSMRTTMVDYLPSKGAADQLIAQYFAAVHYVAKVVHRPSFEQQYRAFWAHISSGTEPTASIQAIVFAAMFSAAVSMTESQVLQSFGSSKSALVDSLRSGTELALSKANFLRTTKTDTMQGFVMYLIPLVRAEVSRAHSALMGSAIRLAECMGLHRDPSLYGINPIETHVRRMIWHQLCFLDFRTCEATGPRPQVRKEDFDTKLPLNINDEELLGPNAPTEDHPYWTDMTLTLLRFELIHMHRSLWFEQQLVDKRKKTLTSILIKLQKFRSKILEKYRPMFDKAVPIQAYAVHVACIYLARNFVMTLNRYLFDGDGGQRMPDRLRQILLEAGTESLEHAICLETKPEFATWAWYKGAYQQYHVAVLFLIHVYAHPTRKEAARIWNCLDYVFDIPRNLSPKEKAELVITDLRDRLQVYHSVRKVKATKAMEDQIRNRSLSTDLRHDGGSGAMSQQDVQIPSFAFTNPAVPPFHFSPPLLHHGDDSSRSATMSIHGDQSGGQMMMEDLDWAELDKYFPAESNTTNLNVSDFDYSNFTGVYDPQLATNGATTYASGVNMPSVDDLAGVNITPTFLPNPYSESQYRNAQ